MTRSARRHRVGRLRIEQALADAGPPLADGDALVYLGRDAQGVALEIVIVPDDRRSGDWAVIHAMPAHYRG